MSPLETYLAEKSSEKNAPTLGRKGKESDWLAFAEFSCKSGKILVIDPGLCRIIENGTLITCSPGIYDLHAKVVAYGSEKRVSRLRVVQRGAQGYSLGDALEEEAVVDVAGLAVCDADALERAWGDDEDSTLEALQDWMPIEKAAVELIIPKYPDATLYMVESGFGDGSFPIFELSENGIRVGFEVELIEPGTPYPFSNMGSFKNI
jgi:hypothetical protein